MKQQNPIHIFDWSVGFLDVAFSIATSMIASSRLCCRLPATNTLTLLPTPVAGTKPKQGNCESEKIQPFKAMNELMLVLPRPKTSKTLCSLPPTLMPSAFLNLRPSLDQWLTFTWLSKPAATKPRPGYNPVALHAHLCHQFWWHSAVRLPASQCTFSTQCACTPARACVPGLGPTKKAAIASQSELDAVLPPS